MLAFPNAKINIGLFITEKRSDNFHNLASCFYPIGWSDILEIVTAQTSILHITGLEVSGNQDDNLCMKAYKLLQEDFDLPSISVFLHKVLPMGAGLGGGSSDAAFMLKLLQQSFNLTIDNSQMLAYARKIGSDCAFFVENTPKYCYEKGDKFEPISLDLKGKYLVVVYPDIFISTKEAYEHIQPKSLDWNLKTYLEKTPIEDWKNSVINDFEKVLFPKYPLLEHTKQYFYDKGALYASMSGSGSSIYGIFEQKPENITFPTNFKVWEEILP
ncbi:MAG: 4-(cytidine 5'-diphospho)-2-C-methyl-D-erythritol kinase [Thermonemataceae bacterium]|nr:4-(cytidine 5'-diphospho)-2-C-methyl-D-erythritol kinase [Thermonemataceae bacterium]